MSITAASTAVSTRYVSSEKSAWPGVSTRLIMYGSPSWPSGAYSNCRAEEATEIPRSFSISIQSETVAFRPALPCTAPASAMTCAWSARASVSVDFPASGCAMTANVRRRCASVVVAVSLMVSLLRRGVGCGRPCHDRLNHARVTHRRAPPVPVGVRAGAPLYVLCYCK